MKVKKCSIIAHRAKFGTEIECKEFLVRHKWSKGYTCRKCSHPYFIKGKTVARQIQKKVLISLSLVQFLLCNRYADTSQIP